MLIILLLLIISAGILYLIYKRSKQFDTFSNPERWAIIQYDNRPLSQIDKEFIERNKRYARRHSYDYIFLKDGYEAYPPYWAKVAIMRDYLEKYNGVFWIDTDAVITGTQRRIEELADSTKSFVMCPDPPMWSAPFNAGVWAVRNTEQGRAIMDDWMAIYTRVADQWTLDGDKWISKGSWAGDSYEQGAFSAHILPKHRNHIAQLEWPVFQSVRPETPGTFALHFSAHQKEYRQEFLNENPIEP